VNRRSHHLYLRFDAKLLRSLYVEILRGVEDITDVRIGFTLNPTYHGHSDSRSTGIPPLVARSLDCEADLDNALSSQSERLWNG